MVDLSTVKWSDLVNEVGRRIGSDVFNSAVEMFDMDREYYDKEGLSEQVIVSDSEEMIDGYMEDSDLCADITHAALTEYRRKKAEKFS